MGCEAIDDVFECLQKLENQSKFTKSMEKHKEDLKFLLRYVKMHLKWKASFTWGNMQNWLQDIETRLVQPSRNGSMAADFLEDVLLSLVGNNRIKEDLDRHCYFYYQNEFSGKLFAYKPVLIDELVMDCLDPLLDNLKHLIQLNDLDLLAFSIEKIKELEEKLMSIRIFLEIIGKEFETKDDLSTGQDVLFKTSENLLTKVKVLIENAVNLSYKIWRQCNIFSMEKFMYDLLVKMNHIEPEIRMVSFQFLQASKRANVSTLGIDLQALVFVDSLLSNLEELKKDSHEGSIIPLDDHLLTCLHKELSFLKYFLMDPHSKKYIEHEPNFISLLMEVEAMAREAAPLACFFYDEQKEDDLASEMKIATNLLEILNLLKAEIRHVYQTVPKPSISNFPRTPSLRFVEFVLQNLKNLLQYRADSVAHVKAEIETVLNELSPFVLYFKMNIFQNDEHISRSFVDLAYEVECVTDLILASNFPNWQFQDDEHISRSFVDLAYEAECVTDLILASNFPNWQYMLWLYDVIEKIKHFKIESKEIDRKKTPDNNLTYIHIPLQVYPRMYKQAVVGFGKEADMIISQLIEGPKQLDIVSIVGMAGTGKTTLAKDVYEDPAVIAQFPIRSWYCISQVYRRRDLLLNILGDVIELNEDILKMNDEDMDLVLYRSLEGKKFLIVIDDIWSIEPWNDICNSFPDDDTGSRILFTSRIPDVALLANPRRGPRFLPLFSHEDSWLLLRIKVFKHQNLLPKELIEIGMDIARKCEGLPFSLVVVAGILVKTEKTIVHWRRILEQLNEQVYEDYPTSSAYILEMSYKSLPDNLKACLLYLGAFPEDAEIPTWKLIRLWIAEGFVQNTKNQSLENVAEDYLMDLIDRNLVLIAKNKSNGGVKSCHVHDLVHEFCLKKAAEENILLVSKDMVSMEQYRHSFYCQENTLRGWMPHGANIRSLFFFPTERFFNFFYDLSILSFVLKLIRVLDLERIPLKKDKFPTEIELLVHLRYLAIGGELDHLPSSVGNLWRLETLLVMGTKGEVKLPETLLKMAHLKHVYVRNWAAFEFSDTFQLETSLESDSVQQLSILSVRLDDGTLEKIFRRLKRLRKLKCVLLESRDNIQDLNLDPILTLGELESLNMTFRGSSMIPEDCLWCDFGSKLRKLTLSNFRLPWSSISMIGCLSKLEVLKLLSEACVGPLWDVPDGTFPRLKFLKLQNLDLEELNAGRYAFPCLQRLFVEGCRNLYEIPFGLGEISSLNMIKLRGCSDAANKAARTIQEEQDDYGQDHFRLHIQ